MITFDTYIVRPLEVSDIEPYFDLVQRNRHRLEDFFTGTVSRTRDFKATKAFLTEISKKREQKLYFPYLLIDTTSDSFIAFFDLKNIDWTIPKAEVGCYTDEKYSGKGITTKAMDLFIKHCFNYFGFKKMFLRTHNSNKAAQVLAEKCGFEKEGLIRLDYKTSSGKIVDLIYYGKLNIN